MTIRDMNYTMANQHNVFLVCLSSFKILRSSHYVHTTFWYKIPL